MKVAVRRIRASVRRPRFLAPFAAGWTLDLSATFGGVKG